MLMEDQEAKASEKGAWEVAVPGEQTEMVGASRRRWSE